MINCWRAFRPMRHRHYGDWHRHIHWHIGHGHGHIVGAIAGAVGAAAAVIVCTEFGPGLWGPGPYLGQPYSRPGLGPEELSGAPVPFIGGPGFPVGIVGRELAAPSVPNVGNGSRTSEIKQIGNRGSLPGSIEMTSTPAVAVIGQVPEPSSAFMLIGAVLAMALLRVRRSWRLSQAPPARRRAMSGRRSFWRSCQHAMPSRPRERAFPADAGRLPSTGAAAAGSAFGLHPNLVDFGSGSLPTSAMASARGRSVVHVFCDEDIEPGDGIMSAIDFDMAIERQLDPKDDCVKLTLSGKFLPYEEY